MKRAISSDRVLKTSFIVDFSDVLLNLFVAILSGSAVMLAQSLQGFADLLTSGVLLIGLKRSRRHANARHRFGYGKEIYFWTLISGLMMLTVTATLSFYHRWQHLFHPPVISYTSWAIVVLVIGVFTNSYALSISYRRLTAHGQSIWQAFWESVLVEIKAAFILDLMGTTSGFFGLISLLLYAATGNSQFDGLGAMAIGVSIAFFAILLVMDVRDLLIGRSVTPEIADEIRATALAIKGVEGVLDLRTMYFGSENILVNLELDIAPHFTTEEIERLIDIIKAEIKSKVPMVHHIQVELETPHRSKKK